ncbi:hypothetical protein [Pseudoduganella rhizocola]|uniref:hypothetical protein n=1 Tax=Pseudoduganella rhizocola TaxID=3382643 RepID=UPI0038B6A6A3
MRYLVFLLFICGFAHAQEEALPAPEELMALAFPKWTDDSDGRLQTIKVNAVARGWAGAGKSRAATRQVIVQPKFATRLGPKRIALIATLAPAYADGTPDTSHAQPLGIAAYMFTPSKAGWKLSTRQEPFALHGFFGAADISELQLAPGHPAVLAEYGSCWQGYCNSWITLYDFDAKGVRAKPALQQTVEAQNTGALAGCPGRLAAVMPTLRPVSDGTEEDFRKADAQRCISVKGAVQVAQAERGPGDITIEFTGGRSESVRGVPQPAEAVAQKMRFVYRAGKYEVEAGRNPAPAF